MTMNTSKEYESGGTSASSADVSEPLVQAPCFFRGSPVPGAEKHLTTETEVSAPAQGGSDRGTVTESMRQEEAPDSSVALDRSGRISDEHVFDEAMDSFEETGLDQEALDVVKQYSTKIERAKPRFLLVKGEFLNKNSIFLINAMLKKKDEEFGGGLINIEKGRGNFRSLVLEVSEKVVDSWRRVTNIMGQYVSVVPHPTKNTVRGKFVDRDGLLDWYCDKEVFEFLESQAVVKVERIRRWERKQGKRVEEGTRTFIVHFALRNIPSEISIGFVKIKVKHYVQEPLRCFKCQQYGHNEKVCDQTRKCRRCGGQHGQCDEPVKCSLCEEAHYTGDRGCIRLQEMKDNEEDTRVCYKCCRVGHVTRDCKEDARCKRCLGNHGSVRCVENICCPNCKGAHEAGNKKCPVYLKNYNIMELVATQQISVAEARRRVGDSPLGGTMSQRISVSQAAEASRISLVEKEQVKMKDQFMSMMAAVEARLGNKQDDERFRQMEQRLDIQDKKMRELGERNGDLEKELREVGALLSQRDNELAVQQRARGTEKRFYEKQIQELKEELENLKRSGVQERDSEMPVLQQQSEIEEKLANKKGKIDAEEEKKSKEKRDAEAKAKKARLRREEEEKKETLKKSHKQADQPRSMMPVLAGNNNRSTSHAVKRLNSSHGKSSTKRPSGISEHRLKEVNISKVPELNKLIKTGGSHMDVESPNMKE